MTKYQLNTLSLMVFCSSGCPW